MTFFQNPYKERGLCIYMGRNVADCFIIGWAAFSIKSQTSIMAAMTLDMSIACSSDAKTEYIRDFKTLNVGHRSMKYCSFFDRN